LFEILLKSAHICQQAKVLAENRTSSYQQIHAHKPLFVKLGKVLNLGHLDFDIVSDFVLRISNFASLGPLHLSRILYKSARFLQNKPNFKIGKMNANFSRTKDYQDKPLLRTQRKQTQSAQRSQ